MNRLLPRCAQVANHAFDNVLFWFCARRNPSPGHPKECGQKNISVRRPSRASEDPVLPSPRMKEVRREATLSQMEFAQGTAVIILQVANCVQEDQGLFPESKLSAPTVSLQELSLPLRLSFRPRT